MPNFFHEIRYGRKLGKIICGVDEVGRGPLAGPVVAAAAILPNTVPTSLRKCIQDSKKMSRAAREDLFEPLTQLCRFAIAEASVAEINELNILWASMLAMQRAILGLAEKIDIALIDGDRAPKVVCDTIPIIQGDDKSLSIAAASIIAKVHRDRFMAKLAEEFPSYGWDHNAGYGTSEHLAPVKQFGITIWHRAHFAPVRNAIEQQA